MARPKKDLLQPEKLLQERVAKAFSGITWPAEVAGMTEEFRAQVKVCAKKFFEEFSRERASLTREDRKDKGKYPQLTPRFFPNFTSFAAYNLCSAEDSYETWKKRFAEGRMRAAGVNAQKDIASKIKKIKQLVEQLRGMGLPVDTSAIAAQLGLQPGDFEKHKNAPEPAPEAAPEAEESEEGESEEGEESEEESEDVNAESSVRM